MPGTLPAQNCLKKLCLMTPKVILSPRTLRDADTRVSAFRTRGEKVQTWNKQQDQGIELFLGAVHWLSALKHLSSRLAYANLTERRAGSSTVRQKKRRAWKAVLVWMVEGQGRRKSRGRYHGLGMEGSIFCQRQYKGICRVCMEYSWFFSHIMFSLHSLGRRHELQCSCSSHRTGQPECPPWFALVVCLVEGGGVVCFSGKGQLGVGPREIRGGMT